MFNDMGDILTPIKEALALCVTAEQRATCKGQAWAEVPNDGKRRNIGNFDVEIQEIKAINGGVQLFARAWDAKTGEQVGFGKDGTVDIERFQIYNPPILVPDGTTKEKISPYGDNFQISNFKEDIGKSIDEVLDHTIGLIGKSGAKVTEGLVGRTTAIFYPEAGSGGGNVSCDGNFTKYTGGEFTWAEITGAATCESVDMISATSELVQFNSNYNSKWEVLRRGATVFPTANLPDGVTINQAVISVWPANLRADTVAWETELDMAPYSLALASANALVVGDYDAFGTTVYATAKTYSELTTTKYHDYILNATGIAAISSTAATQIGWRGTKDASGSSPTNPGTTKVAFITCYMADATGTTQDPKLIVVYSSSVKTKNGLTISSAKSINELDMTSIKTVGGLA